MPYDRFCVRFRNAPGGTSAPDRGLFGAKAGKMCRFSPFPAIMQGRPYGPRNALLRVRSRVPLGSKSGDGHRSRRVVQPGSTPPPRIQVPVAYRGLLQRNSAAGTAAGTAYINCSPKSALGQVWMLRRRRTHAQGAGAP